jgi:hypothetical protein
MRGWMLTFCLWLLPSFLNADTQWAVDGCFQSFYPNHESVQKVTDIIQDSRVHWVREQGSYADPLAANPLTSGTRNTWGFLKSREFSVFSLLQRLHRKTPSDNPVFQLPTDLLKIYFVQRFQSRLNADLVNAWELFNEPDLGFCIDNPDQVAAISKVLYLAVRSVRADPLLPEPAVIAPSLASLPSVYWDRIARNGLFFYQEAYNFHYYGWIQSLGDTIDAHRIYIENVQKQALFPISVGAEQFPIWCTEINGIFQTKSDPENLFGRRLQATYMRESVRIAHQKRLALLTAFVSIFPKEPWYSLFNADYTPNRVWKAYAAEIEVLSKQRDKGPKQPLFQVPEHVNPIVVQWRPDPSYTVPNKFAGSYRFREMERRSDGQIDYWPIKGAFRVYNFSKKERRGRLNLVLTGRDHFDAPSGDKELTIPAIGYVDVPVEFTHPKGSGYSYSELSGRFVDAVETAEPPSLIYFAVETPADPAILDSVALQIHDEAGVHLRMESATQMRSRESLKTDPLPSDRNLPAEPDAVALFPSNTLENGLLDYFCLYHHDRYSVTSHSGIWHGMNGVRVQTLEPSQPNEIALEVEILETRDTDPSWRAVAVCKVNGLPQNGWLQIESDRGLSTIGFDVNVQCIDRYGQAWNIYENFGNDYFFPGTVKWLRLSDLLPKFFGNVRGQLQMNPAEIREIQLHIRAPDKQAFPVCMRFFRAVE